jgi:hypothetical protein
MYCSPRGLENSGRHPGTVNRKEDGRPVAHQDDPDARETHTTLVSDDSVPPLEIFPITVGDDSDPDELERSPTAVYEELLHEASNPIDVRLNRFAIQLEDVRCRMLDLLLAGYGPEHSELWGQLAAEMQALIVDHGNLSTDVVIIIGRLRQEVGGSEAEDLTWVIWHEEEVQSCVNRDQCLAGLAPGSPEINQHGNLH